MKKLILIILFLGMASDCFSNNYTADAACQGAWLFTEGSGTTVADSSSNTNTGNFSSSGHPAWAAMSGTGAPAYAPYMVDFTPNDYIDCGTSSTLNPTTGISITMWALRDTTAQWLIGRDVSGNRAYVMGSESVNNLRVQINGANTLLDPTEWPANWNHVAFTGDSSSGYILYMNGVSVNTAAWTAPNVAATNTYLGRRGYSGFEGYYNGKMSETALFSDALSSTEINDIMDNGLVGAAAPPAAVSTTRFIMIN